MIVDKGWAVWWENQTHSFVNHRKTDAIKLFVKEHNFNSWREAYREGFRVLPTTATATVPKKKARKK